MIVHMAIAHIHAPPGPFPPRDPHNKNGLGEAVETGGLWMKPRPSCLWLSVIALIMDAHMTSAIPRGQAFGRFNRPIPSVIRSRPKHRVARLASRLGVAARDLSCPPPPMRPLCREPGGRRLFSCPHPCALKYLGNYVVAACPPSRTYGKSTGKPGCLHVLGWMLDAYAPTTDGVNR